MPTSSKPADTSAKADPKANDNASPADEVVKATGGDPLPTDPQAQKEEDLGLRDPNGGGTRQKEPKPEDMPLEARMTPPAEQLLRGGSGQVVGTPGDQATRDITGLEADDHATLDTDAKTSDDVDLKQ